MKLLFRRSQAKTIFGRPVFKLWARMEFEDDEHELVRYYRFEAAKLIEVIQPGLIQRSILAGFGAFSLCLIGLWAVNVVGFELMLISSFVLGLAGGWIYFDRRRETIFVRDLIHGRYFKCRSIIDLARKEAWLELITSFLRQVLETAKYWDGTEAVPIDALSKQEAKYMVISGL